MHHKLKLAKSFPTKSKHFSQSQTITFLKISKNIRAPGNACESDKMYYHNGSVSGSIHARTHHTNKTYTLILYHWNARRPFVPRRAYLSITYLRMNANTSLRCIAALLPDTNFECGKILQNQKQLISSNYARFFEEITKWFVPKSTIYRWGGQNKDKITETSFWTNFPNKWPQVLDNETNEIASQKKIFFDKKNIFSTHNLSLSKHIKHKTFYS